MNQKFEKLPPADIAGKSEVALELMRTACLLQRKSPWSSTYRHRLNQLHWFELLGFTWYQRT